MSTITLEPNSSAVAALNNTFRGDNNGGLVTLAYLTTLVSGGILTAFAYAIAAMIDAANSDLKNKIVTNQDKPAISAATETLLGHVSSLAYAKFEAIGASDLTNEVKNEKNAEVRAFYKDIEEALTAVKSGNENLETLVNMQGPINHVVDRLNAIEV